MNRCPPAEQLEQLLDERLAASDCLVISAHVSECAACQAHLERLTADTQELTGSLALIAHQKANDNGATVKGRPAFLTQLKELSVRDAMAKPQVVTENGVPTIPGFEMLNELGRGG